MMKCYKDIRLYLVGAFFLLSLHFNAQTYLYVSPDGTGTSFTKQQPGSLIDAKQKVKELVINMDNDVIVVLRGGVYKLSTPLQFNQDDSGKNGYTVKWEAYSGETPILSGGEQIMNWTMHENGIWESSVAGPNFRQLYVNGVRAVRSRTPDRGDDTDMGPYFRIKSWDIKNQKIYISKDDAANIPADGITEMVINTHWDQQRVQIARITTMGDSAQISINPNEWSLFTTVWPQREPDQPYYFENSYSFLNKPEEWFYDRNGKILYYMPLQGVNPNQLNIEAPRLDSLLELSGTHDVCFKGITFEYSGYTAPDSIGVIDVQDVPYMPGIITLTDTKNITFEDNVICHTGGQGIIIQGFTSGNRILGNLIYDIAANGIVIRGQGSYGDYIGQNTIFQTGRDYTGSIGILAQLPANLVIENNTIFHSPYGGISLGWSWNNSVTSCINDTVRNNRIYKTMELHDDSGGIYTLGRQDGTAIYGNYINNIFHSPWSERFPTAAIYLDQGSMNLNVYNNVIDSVEQTFNYNSTDPNNVHDNNYSIQIKQSSGPSIAFQKDIPTAVISSTANEGIAPLTVILNGSNSYDTHKDSLTYEWLLPTGDRDTSAQLQYQFNNPGIYRIQLKVTNKIGLFDIAVQTFIIHAQNTGINLALNKPSTESSEYSSYYTSSKGNDGQIGTIWSSSISGKGWWQVDLKKTYNISEIQLVARQNDTITFNRIYFQVWGSNSPNMANAVALGIQSSTPYPKNGIWYAFPTNQGAYRYLRIMKPVVGSWNFAEFRAFGTEAQPTDSLTNTDIKVFPNPANSILIVTSSNIGTDYQLMVYSILGETLTVPYNISNGKCQIQTTSLENGIYLGSLHKSNHNLTFRFIINHL
ncbi:right-handed parallel beta-helix repeat-containing protein [Microbacter margulisiae]|uniref:PKD domain-containing protein n=1 Tax=Microbacter margulisiae TaxID=1350067 RepID=A0A7W5H123_9PORP|nr:right-handed parallel beta-helix repeat-containing protein [Microbacter margulisiae]MBB3186199.1 hypothetical protein [Microbacter margulisiae]